MRRRREKSNRPIADQSSRSHRSAACIIDIAAPPEQRLHTSRYTRAQGTRSAHPPKFSAKSTRKPSTTLTQPTICAAERLLFERDTRRTGFSGRTGVLQLLHVLRLIAWACVYSIRLEERGNRWRVGSSGFEYPLDDFARLA